MVDMAFYVLKFMLIEPSDFQPMIFIFVVVQNIFKRKKKAKDSSPIKVLSKGETSALNR